MSERRADAATAAQLSIVIIIAVGFFVVLHVLMFQEVPPGNKDALEIMLGVLGTQFANVVLHYFRPAANGGTPAGASPLSKSTDGNSAVTS